MRDKKEKFKYWIEVIGIICAILIILIWWEYFNLNDGVSWAIRGQLGDSFGSLNTLFSGLAFAGIIFTILLQRRELGLQRSELELTRKEFSSNRLTNIFYQQINMQQKAIEDFSITSGARNDNHHSGYSAFLYLDSKLGIFLQTVDDQRSEEELLNDKIAHYRAHMQVYLNHEQSLLDFAVRTSNSVSVLKNVLASSDLNGQEMKEFTQLFFNNLGFHVINLIRDLVETFNEFINFPEGRKDNPPMDIKRIGLAWIQFKQVLRLLDFEFDRAIDKVKNELRK